MRIVVLGGTRFIGLAILEELLAHGHEPLVVHRGQSEPDELGGIPHVHVERAELASVAGELAAFRPDAALDTSGYTQAHADAALAALPHGVKLAVLSSMDVYHAYGGLLAGVQTDPTPIDETSPVREVRYPFRDGNEAMHDYEKLDVEDAFLARGATVLRLPMVYGERDYQRREEPVLRRVRAGRKRIPVGAGAALFTRGYVRDVAAGVRLALESDGVAGEIFNLGESRTWTIGAWMQLILAAAGSDAELVRAPDDALPEDLSLSAHVPQHLLVDSSKARRVLGWTDTDQTIAIGRSVDWHLAHPPEGASDDFSADDAALA